MNLKMYRWIPIVLLYIILVVYHQVVYLVPGDDLNFLKLTQQYSLPGYVYMRYYDWSGRAFSEALEYITLNIPLIIWYILNPLFLMGLAYGLVRIWKEKVDILAFFAAFAMIGYFAQSTLSAAFFWVTGTQFYLWPLTLGLFAITPYADKVLRGREDWDNRYFVLCVILGVCASMGTEQISLCMTAFAVLSHVAILIQRKKQSKRLLLFTALMAMGTSILVFSPGNKVRTIEEAAYWYPGFNELSIRDHFYIGFSWAFERVFIDMKFIVLLLTIVVLVAYMRKETKKGIWTAYTLILLVSISVYAQMSKVGTRELYMFNEIKKFDISANILALNDQAFLIALLPYIFWIAYGLLLLYVMMQVTRSRFFVLVCVLAAACCLIVMFFSPTIYGSGNRSLAVSSVLLSLVTIGILIENQLIRTSMAVYFIGLFALLNFAHMYSKWFRDGFNSFL
ncbi:DUF6056 family protein [Ectobacillus sp. JY-23]|uniref:DUF6056 family protein n=1 Tax=Ectobacillus sp. JY-23 TaxID=2933872 RepID=UPI001FF6A6B9|nr:DUF6056 family protein [Ectobacillus sp. JY-23]UOY91342.1 DUF6056 family protein [Ectobacillus sp. JY-23]